MIGEQTVRLLLIEDNPGDARLVRELFSEDETGAFSLERVDRLSAGLELLDSQKFSAVLLDLLLPDASGINGFEQIQKLHPEIPVIILTGFNDEELALDAVRHGAEDYVSKGQMDSALLIRTVRYAIERHESRKELDRLATELRASNTRLEKLAFLDPLTGLLNRRGLQDMLGREMKNAERNKSEILVLLVDLDNFKDINDSYGYVTGDAVLSEISNRIRRILRASDVIARVGGDEFILLLPDSRPAEGVRVAEKIRASVAAPIERPGHAPLRVTVSLGAVSVQESSLTVDELLEKTNSALHQSKRSGKNRVHYETGRIAMPGEPFAKSDVFARLRSGGDFFAVMEPICRVEDASPAAYEILSRSRIPGMEMPDQFFRYSLENDLLTMVDRMCLRNCAAHAARSLPPETRRHMNLFPSTLFELKPANLIELFPQMPGAGTCCIEISEQQIIGDPNPLAKPLRELKEAGFLIAIEDVGFGKSALETLILIEPDIIKIDRKCSENIASDRSRQRSFKRLFNVTRALAAEIIAEGVESPADLDYLRAVGVPFAQGRVFRQASEQAA